MSQIALIAHDTQKDKMVAWCGEHIAMLKPFPLVATGTTGGRVEDAHPTLVIRRVKSGPLGGDQQIGAMIAEGEITALIFLVDPLSAMPHDVDVKALTRLAALYDVPLACNISTANAVMAYLVEGN